MIHLLGYTMLVLSVLALMLFLFWHRIVRNESQEDKEKRLQDKRDRKEFYRMVRQVRKAIKKSRMG